VGCTYRKFIIFILYVILLTISKERSPCHFDPLSCLVWNPKTHYALHHNSQPNRILAHLNTAHVFIFPF
jgi:hypothetical protein